MVHSILKKTAFAILCLVLSSNLCAVTSVRVGNYNLRFAHSAADTGACAWENRYTYVCRTIADNDFDVCGLNELDISGSDDMIDDLKAELGTTYAFYTYAVDGNPTGTGNGIAFKVNRFTLLASGVYYLSADPSQPLKSWDSSERRNAVWVHLQDKTSKEDFYCFATHMDVKGVTAKREGARIHQEMMQRIAGHKPCFLVGDFNSNPTYYNVHRWLGAYYDDACAIAKTPYTGPTRTLALKWNGETKSNTRLDWIYTNCEVDSYTVITEQYGREYAPSDHYAIQCVATLIDRTNDRHLWYVNANASEPGNGSKSSPFASLTDAITAAHKGDTLLLTAGTYSPTMVDKTLTLSGGWDDTYTIQSADSYSVFDAAGQAHALQLTNNSAVISLYHICLQGGNATGGTGHGGGLYSRGSVEMHHCRVINNTATQNGGGIYAEGLLRIYDSYIANNTANTFGGGIYEANNYWRHDIQSTAFVDNKALAGSAIYLLGLMDGYFLGNSFYLNSATRQGTVSIMGTKEAYVAMVNNVWMCNTVSGVSNAIYDAQNGGGAVLLNAPSTSKYVLVGNTIVGNYTICRAADGTTPAAFKGGAVHTQSGQIVLLANIIAGNYSSAATADASLGSNGSKTLSDNNAYSGAGTIGFSSTMSDKLLGGYATACADLTSFYQGTSDTIFHPTVYQTATFPALSIIGKTIGTKSMAVPIVCFREKQHSYDMDGNCLIKDTILVDIYGNARMLNGTGMLGAYEYGYSTAICQPTDNLYEQCPNKFIHQSRLYIRKGNNLYDILGNIYD